MPAYVNKRTAHRWRTLALMVTAVFVAFGSFWLLQAMQADDTGVAGNSLNEPDYIVENFSFVRMNDAGQPRYIVTGARLAHHPDNDVSELTTPVVQSITPGRPRMIVRAERGQVYHAEDRVELIGKVDLSRPATATTQALHATTDALTVLTTDEIMKTDRPVQITLGAASVKAIGMVAENPTQKLHLGGRGEIIYPPRK